MNDGWRKRKETTHGESERETDERLDQDMRKDDEGTVGRGRGE